MGEDQNGESSEEPEGLGGYFVEDPLLVVTSSMDAPIIFADYLWHAVSMNNMLRLSFVAFSADPPQQPNAGFKGRHVMTVVMPLNSLRSTVTYLQDTLADMEAKGVVDGDEAE